MNRSLGRAAPMRFLLGVSGSWIAIRGIMLVGWSPGTASPVASLSQIASAEAMPPASVRAAVPPLLARPVGLAAASPAPVLLRSVARPVSPAPLPLSWHRSTETLRARADDRFRDAQLMLLAAYMSPAGHIYRHATGLAEAATTRGRPASSKRWSGSAWAFLRGGGRASLLSPGGQIGGGQAGARILYRVDHAGRLAVSARLSKAIGGARQTEAAAGIDWKPIATLPVHLTAERRFAIDRGGRNAWTLGASGGVDDVPIAPGWRLDAYGEAGVVGARRRDLYVDGAARIARAIDLGGGRSLAVGGGVWGGAQPGASRLDIGPSVVLRLPIEHHAAALALDWRERTLGHAKPGSGVAFTAAIDF